MAQFFQIHPETPQLRLLKQAIDIVMQGGVIVYPTDSCYALGCHIGDKAATDRIRRIRQLTEKHPFTLLCRDLTEIAVYAKVDNSAYRLLKSHTPGAYTFILMATRVVPRRLQHPKRKTIGIRVPNHPVTHALLSVLGEPLISTTLMLPGDDTPLLDPYEMRDLLEHHVDLVIDGGYCGFDQTTVIDLVDREPVIIREGKGDIHSFQLQD